MFTCSAYPISGRMVKGARLGNYAVHVDCVKHNVLIETNDVDDNSIGFFFFSFFISGFWLLLLANLFQSFGCPCRLTDRPRRKVLQPGKADTCDSACSLFDDPQIKINAAKPSCTFRCSSSRVNQIMCNRFMVNKKKTLFAFQVKLIKQQRLPFHLICRLTASFLFHQDCFKLR